MVSAQVDPMAPPRYKTNQKIPRGPPSPPPPVLHSPPRKVSVEEQKNWIIPPCVSNWKNAKGFTIPLDKRLAADGRGLQEVSLCFDLGSLQIVLSIKSLHSFFFKVTINDNFAKLSEALFIADRHAREEVKIRAEMATKIAAKEKREKEEKLRSLAQRAREERSGIAVPLSTSSSSTAAPAYGASEVKRDGDDSSSSSGSDDDDSEGESDDEKLTEEQRAKMKEREEIRKDKQRQRQREMRLTQMGSDTKAKVLAKR